MTLGAKFLLDANNLRGNGYSAFWGRVNSPVSGDYIFNNTAGTPASNVQLVLTTVPEPASLLLLVVAPPALSLRRRRREKRLEK